MVGEEARFTRRGLRGEVYVVFDQMNLVVEIYLYSKKHPLVINLINKADVAKGFKLPSEHPQPCI